MEDMRKQIGDHDQVIKTRFIRDIETFDVFVGIFATVVVVMRGMAQELAKTSDLGQTVGSALSPYSALTIVTLVYCWESNGRPYASKEMIWANSNISECPWLYNRKDEKWF